MLSKISKKKEISNFLKEKQFSEWKKLFEIYIQKIDDTSIDEKEKKFWIIKLYSLYIQFIEIFSINIFIITENNLFDNLFINNRKLKEKISKQLGSNEYIEYLIKNWIFGLKERKKINNLTKKENCYRRLLKEVVKDYVDDQDLLNAYKHGFRLESKGYTNIKLFRDDNPEKTFSIGDYNSSIHYWSRGKKTEKDIIFENRLFFNWQMIEQKFILIDNILENVLKVFFANGTKIQLSHLYIDDPVKFDKQFGILRMRMPIFSKNKGNGMQNISSVSVQE